MTGDDTYGVEINPASPRTVGPRCSFWGRDHRGRVDFQEKGGIERRWFGRQRRTTAAANAGSEEE